MTINSNSWATYNEGEGECSARTGRWKGEITKSFFEMTSAYQLALHRALQEERLAVMLQCATSMPVITK